MILTDLFQLAVIVAGVIGCALAGLQAVQGLPGLKASLSPAFFSFPLSPGFSALDLGLLLLVVGSTYLTGPDMLSRLFCSREVASARRGIGLSIAVIVPLALLISLIGMEAKALFPAAAPEAAFPLLMKSVLPRLLGALTMLALLSAFLSSADTTLLTMFAVLAALAGGSTALAGKLLSRNELIGANFLLSLIVPIADRVIASRGARKTSLNS